MHGGHAWKNDRSLALSTHASTVWSVLKGRCCIVQPSSFAVGMHSRADRYRSIAIGKGYRTVKILWPTDDCSKSSRLYKWENRAIFSHFWRNLLAYSTVVLYEKTCSVRHNEKDECALRSCKENSLPQCLRCCGERTTNTGATNTGTSKVRGAVSYTHLTLPTTPYV